MSMPAFADEKTKLLLKGIPYFMNIEEGAILEDIAKEIVVLRYKAGEMIFLEGDKGSGLHLVTEGKCKISRLAEQGREHVLATLEAGDSCNEVPAVDGGTNPVNLWAVEDATLWVISAESLAKLRSRYPILNEAIINNLAMRCRQLVQRVFNLSFLSVTGRLAAFLLQQSEVQGQLSRQEWTQDEIASHLGTVREMVGRALRDLHQAELIAIDRHRIEIIDREGLEELT